jgi:hypothetical protein
MKLIDEAYQVGSCLPVQGCEWRPSGSKQCRLENQEARSDGRHTGRARNG